jgi:multisite-specific tRNA:(cytosine-C5)-methyltransferase
MYGCSSLAYLCTRPNTERCLRCVPQDEDTGGFFVATLRKVPRTTAPAAAPVPATVAAADIAAPEADAEATAEEAAAQAAAVEDGEPTDNAGKESKMYKGPVNFQQWDEEAFLRMKQFYGFRDTLSRDAFFIREDFALSGNPATNAPKSIYLIPASVRALLNGDRDKRLKVVMAGVKVFEKKVLRSGDIDYRLLQVRCSS